MSRTALADAFKNLFYKSTMLKELAKEEKKIIQNAFQIAKQRMNATLVRGAPYSRIVRDAEFLIMVSAASQVDATLAAPLSSEECEEQDYLGAFFPVGSLVQHVLDSRRGIVIGRDARNELIVGDYGESSRQSHYHVIWDHGSRDFNFSSSPNSCPNDLLHSYIPHELLSPLRTDDSVSMNISANLPFGVNKAPSVPVPGPTSPRELMNVISGTFSAPSAISNPLMGHFFQEIQITAFATNSQEKEMFSNILLTDADRQQPYLVFTRYLPQSPIRALYEGDFLSSTLPEAIAEHISRTLAPALVNDSSLSKEVRSYPRLVLHNVYDRLVHRSMDKDFDSLVVHGLFSGVIAFNSVFEKEMSENPSNFEHDPTQLSKLTNIFLHCIKRERETNRTPVRSTSTSPVREFARSIGPEQEKST